MSVESGRCPLRGYAASDDFDNAIFTECKNRCGKIMENLSTVEHGETDVLDEDLYKRWLASTALSDDLHCELETIQRTDQQQGGRVYGTCYVDQGGSEVYTEEYTFTYPND